MANNFKHSSQRSLNDLSCGLVRELKYKEGKKLRIEMKNHEFGLFGRFGIYEESWLS